MFTLGEILKVTKGELKGAEESAKILGVCTDTRVIQPGELFIALKGQNFDGHDYINQAIRKSASVIIACRNYFPKGNKVSFVLVKDTTRALAELARFHRDRFSMPVVAITGSTGKTTTKEMVAAVLETRCHVAKNIATQNNHIGVPSTLLKLTAAHDAAVVELGTNHFGEIRRLTQIANPTIVILTNIGESHLEFFKSPRGVLKEKLDSIKYMSRPGCVIFNNDDRYLKKIPTLRINHRMISFGVKNHCDYQARKIVQKDNAYLGFTLNGNKKFNLKTPAVHNVYNALAAIACGDLLKVNLKSAQKALGRFEFPNARQSLTKIGSYWLIDDTYNANPVSFRSAVETLRDMNAMGRKIFICADMLELGKFSEKLHQAMGKLIVSSGVDFVFTIGGNSRLISDEVRKNNNHAKARHFVSLDAACGELKNCIRPNDIILVKGSRGTHMERIIQFLKTLKHS